MGRLRFVLPLMFAFVIVLAASSPVFATKGSYPGVNGKIAFAAVPTGEEEGEDMEIFVMNNDGTGLEQLTHNDVYDNSPCWSPDGTKIAFQHGESPDGQIWVMDANGDNQRQLTTSYYGTQDPAWSPDGSKIAYSRSGNGPEIYVIDAAGPLGGGTLLRDGAWPNWSPDGTKIAYGNTDGNLYVADYSNPLLTTNLGRGAYPCWSPDGSKIVFILSGEIWVMNSVDGSGRLQLSSLGSSLDPNWSPDGTKIAFWRAEDSIWVMNADGSNPQDLTGSNPSLSGGVGPDYQRLPSTSGYVGGEVFSANKLAVLSPYLALISVVAVAAVLVKHRRT